MINRLSHSRLGDISFIALVTISYFVPRSLRSLVTKYDILSRAIKLISPRLSYDNLYLSVLIYSYTNARGNWKDTKFVVFSISTRVYKV